MLYPEDDLCNTSEDPTQYSRIDEMVRMVKTRVEPTNDNSRSPYITIATDDEGEEYVQLKKHPEMQMLASSILRPAANAAQIIVDEQGNKYSHIIDLNKVKNGNGKIALRADVFLAMYVLSDTDHFKNSEIKNVKFDDDAHYLFDFDLAFNLMEDWRIKESGRLGFPQLKESFDYFFRSDDEKAQALKLLRQKINLMKRIYRGADGLKLIHAMCKRAGYKSDDLGELNNDWSQNGTEKLHQFLTFRIAVVKEFLQSEDRSLTMKKMRSRFQERIGKVLAEDLSA